jgi:SAM-dependent methyltransferase
MQSPSRGVASAKAAYDAFASAYDDFNHRYMYERWTGRLLAKAEEAGREGDRLLDVACGTGLSFLPMLDRGFEVTGCDISPAMVEVARPKAEGRAELVVADMRELPVMGEFDLVWSVDDAGGASPDLAGAVGRCPRPPRLLPRSAVQGRRRARLRARPPPAALPRSRGAGGDRGGGPALRRHLRRDRGSALARPRRRRPDQGRLPPSPSLNFGPGAGASSAFAEFWPRGRLFLPRAR